MPTNEIKFMAVLFMAVIEIKWEKRLSQVLIQLSR